MTDTPPKSTLDPAPASAVLGALAGLDGAWAVVCHADLTETVSSAADVARQLPLELGAITKTLLVTRRSEPAAYALVVLPVDSRLDTASLAAVLEWEQATLATPEELASQIGQPIGGVSPLGSLLGVVVEETLLDQPHILVGAGVPGFEIEIEPRTLVEVTCGRLAAIVENPSRADMGRSEEMFGA